MLVLGLRRLDEREHLDLVELMDAEDPPRVLAGRARLAAEAGRDPRVADRQIGAVEDLVGVQGGQRHLGGADEEELVPFDLVDHLALAREEAGAVERLLADQHRRDDRGEALAPRPARRRSGSAPARPARGRRAGRRSASRRPRRPSRSRSGRGPARDRDDRGPRTRTRAARRPRAGRRHPHRCRRRGPRDRAGSESCRRGGSRSASTAASSVSSSLIRAETSRIAAIASAASPPSRLAAPIASEASLRCARSALDLGQQLAAAGIELEQAVEVLGGADACQRRPGGRRVLADAP